MKNNAQGANLAQPGERENAGQSSRPGRPGCAAGPDDNARRAPSGPPVGRNRAAASRPADQPRGRSTGKQNPGGGGGEVGRTILQTWSFDSVGPRKYALQLQRARNGNPCLRIVEGKRQSDGSYRKFDLTVWSEDFEALFAHLDQVRAYIAEREVRTPAGHRWDRPRSKGGGRKRFAGRGQSRKPNGSGGSYRGAGPSGTKGGSR